MASGLRETCRWNPEEAGQAPLQGANGKSHDNLTAEVRITSAASSEADHRLALS